MTLNTTAIAETITGIFFFAFGSRRGYTNAR